MYFTTLSREVIQSIELTTMKLKGPTLLHHRGVSKIYRKNRALLWNSYLNSSDREVPR